MLLSSALVTLVVLHTGASRQEVSMTTVSTTVPKQGFIAVEAKGQRWFGAASGVLFVFGWIASLLLPSRLAPVPVPFPNPMTSSSQDMLNYYAQAQTTATIGSI